ncbi:MAG TPA: aminotransferase class V-fold PLP-dependent enzyme [Vicinamibacterales bacterium]|nr:aminotransferase class V-fold PLP-dependent enzyme [Vicinamibacterales bacterium]
MNHGTVGVTPRRILAVQQAIRDEMERHPSRFILRALTETEFGRPLPEPPRLRAAADQVAAFLGARGADLVFVDNITAGANSVLRSFPLRAGDEILVSDLVYGGVLRAALFAARERGATVRTVEMPYPFRADQLADAYANAVGPRTRLAIVEHITAQSALVFPLRETAARLRASGVAVLADAAHAPGQIPVDIPSLGVDWYVGNLHKWAWTPRSSGILWAAPEWQAELRPTVISWGLDKGFKAEFDMLGTRDPSAHLSAPSAIALMREWGMDAIQAYNHTLAWTGAHRLAERWQTTFDVPEAMIASMATVALPEAAGSTTAEAQALRDALFFDDAIEVQMHAYRGRVWARISGQIYNDINDIDRLAEAVAKRVGAAT